MNRHLDQVLRLGVAGAVLLSLTLAGVAHAADPARVRVLHASPDAPAVDIHLDDEAVEALTNVPFATISDYLDVPAGDHNVKVYATGTTTDPVIDADVSLAAGAVYTIAATDAVASIDAQVLEDEPSPDCDGAQVRVIHFSADAPAVDVATAGADPADALVAGLAYPDATGYLDLPAGSYDLEVRLAGTTDVALDLAGVTVDECTAYSVFAIGSAATPPVGGNALQAVVAVDATASAGGGGARPTLPPTDTLAAGDAAVQSADGIGPAILVVLGLLGFATASLWLARRRALQDQ
jgi:hypothetical protein